MRKKKRDSAIYYLMGAPAAILFIIFYLYPALNTLRYSATRWNGIDPVEFVGVRNFVNLLTNDDLFLKVLGNNVRFTLLVVLFQTSFALLFAIFLVKNTKTTVFLRTLYFFPTILSSVSVAMIWLFLYDPNVGVINTTLTKIGLDSLALNWLGSESTALSTSQAYNRFLQSCMKRQRSMGRHVGNSSEM